MFIINISFNKNIMKKTFIYINKNIIKKTFIYIKN